MARPGEESPKRSGGSPNGAWKNGVSLQRLEQMDMNFSGIIVGAAVSLVLIILWPVLPLMPVAGVVLAVMGVMV